MKKLLFTLLLLFSISFSSFSQNWTKIYGNEEVTVETKTIDCNPTNKLYPNTYTILRYSNLTNHAVDFNFKILKWYNNVLHEDFKYDVSDEEAEKSIHLTANQVIEGDCNSKSETYSFLYKNNHPKMDIQLTNLEINEIKTK